MRRLNENERKKLDNFLNKNYLENINIIGYLKNVPDAEIWVNDGDEILGVVVKYKDEGNKFIFNTYDKNIVKEAVDDIFSHYSEVFLAAIRDELASQLFPYGYPNENGIGNYCIMYYYPKKTIDISDIPNNVKNIQIDDAKTVDFFYTYRHSGSFEILKKDIASRPSAAYYIDDEIISWSLLHPDNSMGVMFTKPQYRKHNYGYIVSKYLMNEVLKTNEIPFVHIVENNNASVCLAEKLSLVYGYRLIWFDYYFKK
ncbi:MAG: GNAT family N-acetyltransferase [Clostridia bacterium]